ncbi:porin [Neorhizobium sp. JUb45]|uniref:porin n=1 Tax=unclassified Neorhizobium TaxID=2629175 RepID=UPI00104FD2F5|nr:porin [Neorhizobium sp. JUb45]TCR04363.1 porin-like protein [Neorhizobium sp. JUb45]
MNIKSLLLGSAAALAAVSGAQAADAIVAAEPEPMEYVRVCDAFGTGYFYIPGTETCLKIGGYVRTQIDGRSEFAGIDGGYRTNTRGKLQISAKSDTELGTLASIINMEANTNGLSQDFVLKDTFIELGGLRVGYFFNYFDTGLPGETVLADGRPGDVFGGGFGANTLNNSIRYTFDGGAFQAYIQADAFNSEAGWKTDLAGNDDEIGVNGVIAGKLGAVSIDFFAGYDFGTEEAAFASTLTAELGPGKLGVFAAYATGSNSYFDAAEWTVGAEYAIAVTDKLSITPGAQYWDNIVFVGGQPEAGDAWRAGVTADYKITQGLTAKATVNYTDVDSGAGSDDRWDGFFRLQRSF